ncbi:uncharacterized protein [Watersipora subatra]|uniref:uncharacterized protein n=1 Tax=Watersipora subatra TaxID=2589382 RepID=UPI00355B1EAF
MEKKRTKAGCHCYGNGNYNRSPKYSDISLDLSWKETSFCGSNNSQIANTPETDEQRLLSSNFSSIETQADDRDSGYVNSNQNSGGSPINVKDADDLLPQQTRTKLPDEPKTVTIRQSHTYVDCAGRRQYYIGEKCFAVLVLFLTFGILLGGLGSTCLLPLSNAKTMQFCENVGGMTIALIVVSTGGLLVLIVIISCILIRECSNRELHGGKCHINCHIFEDLVV